MDAGESQVPRNRKVAAFIILIAISLAGLVLYLSFRDSAPMAAICGIILVFAGVVASPPLIRLLIRGPGEIDRPADGAPN